eukprot:30827-Pelagococcus_subviridis.AAC.19
MNSTPTSLCTERPSEERLDADVLGSGPRSGRDHVPGDDRRGADRPPDRRVRGPAAGDAARVLPRRRLAGEQSDAVQGAFSSHWFPYDRVGVVHAVP